MKGIAQLAFLLIVSVLSTTVYASSQENSQAGVLTTPFVFNEGQLDSEVACYASLLNGTLFVTREGKIVYALPTANNTLVLEEELLECKAPSIEGRFPAKMRVHCYRGSDSSKWRNDLPSFTQVSLGEAYDNIEVVLHSRGDNIEKLFYVKPGGHPESIRIRVNGAKSLSLNEAGELIAKTDAEPVGFTKPIAFQHIDGQKVSIDVEYAIREDSYGFRLGSFDPDHLVVIDPLIASTFLGGNGGDNYCDTAQDASGNIYVAGSTASQNFPTTTGVYDPNHNGNVDVFVACLDKDLTTMVCATFIGGSGSDTSFSMEREEATGRIYVSGETNSTDFPVTANAYDQALDGDFDAFTLRLTGDLSTLVASTYLGGSQREQRCHGRLDGQGNLFVTGHTNSSDFPMTANVYDDSFNGGTPVFNEGVDYFIARLDADLSALEASTYLGGTGCEILRCMTVDTDGSVFVSGLTTSADYPTTAGAYDSVFHGGSTHGGDTLISRLDNDLTTLLGSTYLGSSADDWAICLLADGAGSVYLTGDAFAGDFPTTPGAYDRTFHGGMYGDIILVRMDTEMTTLEASTFLGGAGGEYGISLLLEENDTLLVCGITQSKDFPTTEGAYNMRFNGGERDCFMARFDRDLTTMSVCTYLGGKSYDSCGVMGKDEEKNIYLVGNTRSNNYPTTPGAFIEDYMGGSTGVPGDVFISKFDPDLSTRLYSDEDTFSCTQGGTIDFSLLAGEENADRTYLLLLTMSGIDPGHPLPGGQATLPLNWDVYTNLCISLVNSPLFHQFLGILDGSGKGTAQLNSSPIPFTLVGETLHFAYALNKPFDFVSNAIEVSLVW